MKNGIERRRHLRAPLHLPFAMKVAQGDIKAKTVDISVSGLSTILPLEASKIGDEFQIILKPSENHIISVTCKKVWTDSITVHESIYIGIGVQFTKISSSDQKIIASMVEEFYRV